jgi:hypothetical protein
VYAPVSTWEVEAEGWLGPKEFKANLGNTIRPCFLKKNTQHKRIGSMVQVVELLPSKHEALSSNPNMAKTNYNKKQTDKFEIIRPRI